MAHKLQTKSHAPTTATVNAKTGLSRMDYLLSRANADAELSVRFLSRITTDTECFLSRITTTLQEFNDGQVRELKRMPVISARLGKLSANDAENIDCYIASGVGHFSCGFVYSPNPKHFATGGVTISFATDKIDSKCETYIIREISNLFVHTADEVERHELGHALLVFKDEANPNFATAREILRRCVAFANELSPPTVAPNHDAELLEAAAERGGAVAARIALDAAEAGAIRDTRKPLSSKEAANELGYKNIATIQELVRKGKLKPIGKGRNYKFTWEEIERFKNANKS